MVKLNTNFKNKRILVMGLGLNGGAFQVLKWLLAKGAKLTVTDIKTAQVLKPTLDQIKKLAAAHNIKFILGEHRAEDFKNKDLLIQNPGVPANSVYLKIAKKNKIPIVNEAVMFFALYPHPKIAVTGTRGKSSTSSIIHHILKQKIKTNVIAGNIATTPMFAVLDKLKKDSLPVLELSSWHLENLGDYKASPQISVLTNVLVDHLNRYKDFNAYKQAKINIIKYQTKNDFAILNWDNIHTKTAAKYTKAKVYYFSLINKVSRGVYLKNNNFYFVDHPLRHEASKKESLVMTTQNIKLLGQHNLSNIAAAICVAKIIGIDNSLINKGVNSFKGVAYRLQLIKKTKNLQVFNDATSTTPDATEVAILAMQDKTIVLLAGGQDKNLDYQELAKIIKNKVAKTILLAGTGSAKLIKELKKIKYPSTNLFTDFNDLEQALLEAKKQSKNQEVLLFSPAAASFNMFTNEFQRAKMFDQLVKKHVK